MEVLINGSTEAASINTAIDTSIITESLARRLGIKTPEPAVVVDGMLNEHHGWHASTTAVRLAGVPVNGLELVVLADDQFRQLARGGTAQFVFGANLFTGRAVHIAFPEGIVTLATEPQGCAAQAQVLHTIGGTTGTAMPVVPVTINDTRERALLDPAVDDALIVAANSKEHVGREVTLQVGARRTVTRAVRRTDTPGLAVIPFVVGRRAFGSSRVTIDFAKGKICLTSRT